MLKQEEERLEIEQRIIDKAVSFADKKIAAVW